MSILTATKVEQGSTPTSIPLDDLPPNLPPMIRRSDGVLAPAAPKSPDDAGLEYWVLADLALKLLNNLPHLTTDYASRALCLPPAVIDRIYWKCKDEQLVEIIGQVDEFNYRYAISPRGREQAKRSFEVSGYVGPAPVSLDAYTAMIEFQLAQRDAARYEELRDLITNALVLPKQAVDVAALATSSGRSLFVFGPAGNGKTSLGRLLHHAFAGDLWIPHCISIDGAIIRLFDDHLHERLDPDDTGATLTPTDRRWVRIKPPFVVMGGEMTMRELDLAYSTTRRFYEAPPHMKANGGTFLIDDFGRQRIEPHELLNRWIIPLEHRTDHLTLHTGQRIEVPFKLMLIVATNLPVSEVSDPAFLRRMGYRLHLEPPTPEIYADVFKRYARKVGVEATPELIAGLLQRYKDEGRELRASEPRELIERARDLCGLRRIPFKLDQEIMTVAWAAYFGLT